jgi:hypothetical protein
MHKTDFWSCLRNSFQAKSYQRGEVSAELREWDTQSGKIGGIERAFFPAAADGHDAVEGPSPILEERKEVGDETEAGVVV